MKLGFIDVGSNSVRLMTWADGKSLYKRVQTTRLAEGLSVSGCLSEAAAMRTAAAIKQFYLQAVGDGAEKVYVFATEAMRSAKNGAEIKAQIERESGLSIDLISGAREAEIGLLGALGGADGCIVDVGGASSEVIVRKNGAIVYAKSLPIGAVRIADACGQNKQKICDYVQGVVREFCDAPHMPVTAIGGTATTLAAVDLALATYDGGLVTGHKMSATRLLEWAEKLLSISVEDRKKIVGMDQKRAEIIGGGATLLYRIVREIGADEVRVSDEDNLEGYARGITGR